MKERRERERERERERRRGWVGGEAWRAEYHHRGK